MAGGVFAAAVTAVATAVSATAGRIGEQTLTPEMCRMQSIGTDTPAHPLRQCLPSDIKRRECGRGSHADLIELEPSLMPPCQLGAPAPHADTTNSSWPRKSMLDVVSLLPNRTVVLLGDSTMRQLFDAAVCDLIRLGLFMCEKGVRYRCKRILRKVGNEALAFVRATHPHTGAWTDFHLTYLHSFPPHETQLWAFVEAGAIDVLIFNFGMHYLLEPPPRAAAKGNISQYVSHMRSMLSRASAMQHNHPHTITVFLQSVAQHFGCKSSYFNAASPKDTKATCAGDWDSRDRTRYFINADAAGLAATGRLQWDCECFPFEPPRADDRMVVAMQRQVAARVPSLDLTIGWRNALAMDLLTTQFARERFGVMRWFEITAPRWEYHRMNCCTTIKSTCDCTHYCMNMVMYHEGFAELHRVLMEQQHFRSGTHVVT